MKKALIVIDMQNDFIDGALGTPEAAAIVRRIFESLGYTVKALDRVYFAGLTKKGLKKGEWRYLSEGEVNVLRMGAYV